MALLVDRGRLRAAELEVLGRELAAPCPAWRSPPRPARVLVRTPFVPVLPSETARPEGAPETDSRRRT